MRSFIRYYKWHLIFSLLVIVCLVFVYVSVTTQIEPDMTICYAGTKYINVQNFNDNKSELELLLKDSNNDGKKIAEMLAYTGDLQKDIDELFVEIIDSENYDIYIASKETFEGFEDKSAFADTSTYITFGENKVDTLEDSDGRTYATSLEENSLAKRLGIVDTEGLYIAASARNKGELSDYEKNGRNITGYIIDNKEKYN